MSGRPLARCQCPKNTAQLRACGRIATAEDLRCDICRIGCRRIRLAVDATGAAGGAEVQITHASSPAALYRARFGTPPRP
ncbi:hypothetical protein [Streptosporangium longisporum]|uniref:Uncharacterized protein n=1 Tax=Streptosporangium longisporum TaxID=46187 RepID=A0ABP6LDN2_9ACTN